MSEVVDPPVVEPTEEELIAALPLLSDTLIYKIGEKVAPGLVDGLIANKETLTEIKMSGATKQTLFGLSTKNSQNWSNKLSTLLGVSTSNSAWAGKMFSLQPYSFVDAGKDVFLTNTKSTAPTSKTLKFPNNQTFLASDLGFNFQQFGQIMQQGSKYLTYAGDAPDFTVRKSCNWFADLRSFVERSGYSPFEKVKPFATHISKSNVAYPTANELKTKLSTGTGSGEYITDFINYHKKELLPGMKWMVVHWFHSGQTAWNKDYWGWLDNALSSSNTYWTMLYIPIIDDGSVDIPMFWYTNELDGKHKLTTFTVDDSRYAQHTHGMRYSATAYARHHASTSYQRPGGQSILASKIPEVGWTNNWESIYSSFLPFLVCPLDDAHYVIGAVANEMVSYQHKGARVEVLRVDAAVKEFYCKISKTWYEEYYTTGFGLFQPKNSNIQANILKDWNALDFDSVGVCIVGAGQGFSSSNLIENLPLFKQYARAREKACKSNDWYDQPYNENMTWGKVRSSINASPNRNVFFCLNGYSTTPTGFNFKNEVMKGVSWTTVEKKVNGVAVKDAYGYSVYLYTRAGTDAVVEANLDETAEVIERVMDEIAQGATGPSMDMLGKKAGLYDSEIAEVNSLKTELTASTLVRTAESLRFNMSNDYYFTQAMLGNNGYPAFSYMQSPAREMMVNRSYAELDKVFGPIVRVINSFTDSVVIDKIIKKL